MRYLLVFLFAWVVVGSVAVWPFQLDGTKQKNQTNTHQANKNSERPVSIAPNRSSPQEPKHHASDETNDSDPKSVRITAVPPPSTWYKAYVAATVVLVLVGIGGGWLAYKTLRQIKVQSDVLINMERAWLHAEVITDTPERKLVPTSTQYPVAATNYGRTVGEIVGYRVSARSMDQIKQLLSNRGQMISFGTSGRRFVAPRSTGNPLFSFDVKQIFELCGLWDDVVKVRIAGVILIEIFYCDVLDRKTERSSRFVYRYDPDVLRLNILPEYTQYR